MVNFFYGFCAFDVYSGVRVISRDDVKFLVFIIELRIEFLVFIRYLRNRAVEYFAPTIDGLWLRIDIRVDLEI